jgi:cytidine deaminase
VFFVEFQAIPLTELIELARGAREHARAPYSKFKVGAVVECADGRTFTGCNVENSSYGSTLCAEQVALAKAVSEGAGDFVRVAVIADTKAPVPPCGACGQYEVRTAEELLPAPFDQSFL